MKRRRIRNGAAGVLFLQLLMLGIVLGMAKGQGIEAEEAGVEAEHQVEAEMGVKQQEQQSPLDRVSHKDDHTQETQNGELDNSKEGG